MRRNSRKDYFGTFVNFGSRPWQVATPRVPRAFFEKRKNLRNCRRSQLSERLRRDEKRVKSSPDEERRWRIPQMNGSASIPDLRFTSFACQLIGHDYRRIYDVIDVPVTIIPVEVHPFPSRPFVEYCR